MQISELQARPNCVRREPLGAISQFYWIVKGCLLARGLRRRRNCSLQCCTLATIRPLTSPHQTKPKALSQRANRSNKLRPHKFKFWIVGMYCLGRYTVHSYVCHRVKVRSRKDKHTHKTPR